MSVSDLHLNVFFAVASLLLFTLAVVLAFKIYFSKTRHFKADLESAKHHKDDGRSTYVSPLSIIYEVSEASMSQIGVMSPEEPVDESIPAWIKTVRQSQLITCPPRSETVGLDRSETVGLDRSETVGLDQDQGKTSNLKDSAMIPIDVKREMEEGVARSTKLEKPALMAFKNNRISQLIKQEFEQ